MTVPVAEDGITQSQPLALIGAAITLPAGIVTREAFYEVIKNKRQVRASGRLRLCDWLGEKKKRVGRGPISVGWGA